LRKCVTRQERRDGRGERSGGAAGEEEMYMNCCHSNRMVESKSTLAKSTPVF